MNITTLDLIGFLGVAIILIAYFLQLKNIIQKENLWYLLLNTVGAGIACFTSILIPYIPFVILEGCWALVSLIGLVSYFKNRKK